MKLTKHLIIEQARRLPRISARMLTSGFCPSQISQWHMVGLEKIGSWLLLISFIMIDLLYYVR